MLCLAGAGGSGPASSLGRWTKSSSPLTRHSSSRHHRHHCHHHRFTAGTTKKGIGPAYASKINRVGLRLGDLRFWNDFEARFRVRAVPDGHDLMLLAVRRMMEREALGLGKLSLYYRLLRVNTARRCMLHTPIYVQALVKAIESQYPRIKIDVEQQLAYYKGVRPLLLPLIVDTIEFTNSAFDVGKKVLVEGESVGRGGSEGASGRREERESWTKLRLPPACLPTHPQMPASPPIHQAPTPRCWTSTSGRTPT